jgi:hypothetical protein
MATKCHAMNAAGEPCQAEPLKGSEYCVWHDPDLAERRKEWSLRGGKGKANAVRAKKRLKRLELQDVDAALCTALVDVLNGELEPGLATAAATVARVIHQVRTATEHEQRITELEKALDLTPKGYTA